MNHRLTVTAAAAAVATSVALYPLLMTAGWFWLGIAAAMVVSLVGTMTRLRPLPFAVCLAAAVAALLLYLNVVFAAASSFGRVLPTISSLRHLWALAGQGIASVHRYAPPVPVTPGILLLTTAGIGIVAVGTDLLAVRLRRPALAGLPLLVLFCVPLSTSVNPGPVGTTIVFSLSVAGYLAVLSADGREKIRLWGRLITLWQPHRRRGTGLETRKLAAAGRRIGFAAAVAALCVPLLLLPGRPAHRLLGGGSGTGGGPGGSRALYLPDPLAVLDQQLHETRPQTVLTYRTSDPAPPYLQVYVLGQLSRNAWSMGREVFQPSAPANQGTLPPPPGLSPATPGRLATETISIGRSLQAGHPGLTYLPVPYPARSITVPGSWRVDRSALTIFAPDARLSGLRYTVTVKDLSPSPQQLRHAPIPPLSVASSLPVPRAFSRLLPLAQRITAHRTTAYGRAVALQRWFTQTGHFTYSLRVPPPHSAAALIDFLTRSKRGYCQQFAFGMAVLARLLGIPSRVVVGYTQGSFMGGTLWRVTTRDAHAWPELYFQGAGWLRFEPTPDGSAGPGQATATPPTYSYPALQPGVRPAGGGGKGGGVHAPRPGGSSRRLAGNLRPQLAPNGAAGPATGGGKRPHRTLPGWLLAVVAGVALVTPTSARSLTRRRRWLRARDDAARADAAWREVTDDLADHGIGPRPSESPRGVAVRVAGRLQLTEPEHAALHRVVAAVERARYAQAPAPSQTLRADVAVVRRGIARSSGPAARWQARLFPASALAPARKALAQALDVFGWLDRLTVRSDGRALWNLRPARR